MCVFRQNSWLALLHDPSGDCSKRLTPHVKSIIGRLKTAHKITNTSQIFANTCQSLENTPIVGYTF
jgi:hypothetical protein